MPDSETSPVDRPGQQENFNEQTEHDVHRGVLSKPSDTCFRLAILISKPVLMALVEADNRVNKLKI